MGAETLPLWLLFWIYSQMYENYFATKQFSKIRQLVQKPFLPYEELSAILFGSETVRFPYGNL